ncbi:MAG: hypothetical protein QXR30_01420 [Candidatus Woesearchaeota archaeon]
MAIIIFFTIVFIIFFIYYSRLQSQNQQNQKEERISKIIIENVKNIRGMDELKCTLLGVEGITCIDLLKLNSLKALINSNEFARSYYSQIFGNSEIELQIIYAHTNEYRMKNISLYASDYSSYKNSKVFFQPIVVYNPETKKNYFAFIKYTYKYN